jgi:hypothetical protein
MAEIYPSDAELAAMSGRLDPQHEVLFVPAGESPYYVSFYKMLYRLLDVCRRAGDLRVYKDGPLTFGVRAGRFANGAQAVAFAGASAQPLADDAVNYIYITAAGALATSTEAFPDIAAVPHVPLATIATGLASAAGASGSYDLCDITDYRALAMMRVPTALEPQQAALAQDFFAGTDMTAGDAQTLIDGSNADTLHLHGPDGLAAELDLSDKTVSVAAPTTDAHAANRAFVRDSVALVAAATNIQDAVTQLANAPAGGEPNGRRYLVGEIDELGRFDGSGASGDFADHGGDIAEKMDGVWTFASPQAGWLVSDAQTGNILVWNAALETWVMLAPDAVSRVAADPAPVLSNDLDLHGNVIHNSSGTHDVVLYAGAAGALRKWDDGEARGAGAIDLPGSFNDLTRVAGGARSAIVGGQDNRTAGADSAALGGSGNFASGVQSAVVGGCANTAAGRSSIALGENAVASRMGELALAYGKFTTPGDVKLVEEVLIAESTGANAVTLTKDGAAEDADTNESASNRIIVPANRCIGGRVTVVAARSSGLPLVQDNLEYYSVAFRCGVYGGAFNVQTTNAENLLTGTTVVLSVNAADRALRITCTGAAGYTYRWAAALRMADVAAKVG